MKFVRRIQSAKFSRTHSFLSRRRSLVRNQTRRTHFSLFSRTREPPIQEMEETKVVQGLGDRMKSYEATTVLKLDPNLPYIIRIDGHKFSSYTRPFNKPFDDRISNCMNATCMDLLVAFHPTTVYTCSDEITMIFPVMGDEADADAGEENNGNEEDGEKKEKEHAIHYNGKVQKLASLTAAYASVCFDRHMQTQVFADNEQKLRDHIVRSKPYFDSRCFNVPSTSELVNNLIWRSHYDFRRNSISTYARSFFTTKEMHKLNSEQLMQKMKDEKGVSWDDLPAQYKYGSFIKKEQFIKQVEINGKTIDAVRSRPVAMSFKFATCSPENEAFLTSKYAPEAK